MHTESPKYQQFIPQTLWGEVESLLEYVSYFPYQRPTQCPYCGCHSFRERNQINTVGQPRFECNHCDRNFSQLTGSYFSQMKQIELWPDFIKYRLVGMPLKQIREKLGMSGHATVKREEVLIKMLNDLYPKLAAWWIPHHLWQDKRLTQTVAEQKKQFMTFLDYVCFTQTMDCPYCHHTVKRIQNSIHRPYFVCGYCKKSTNLLRDTFLYRLDKIEQWHTYAQYILQGESNKNITRLLNISSNCAIHWRNCFTQQIKAMGLDELLAWIDWQRTRRQATIIWPKRRKNSAKSATASTAKKS